MASLAMETALACCPAMASKRKPPWRGVENGGRGGVGWLRGRGIERLAGAARGKISGICRARQWPSQSRALLEGLGDVVGGDLLGFDLAQWEEDVENHGALAFYAPHEGGYEGRYASRLRCRGYHFLDLTARGLGDVEAYLSKIHGVRPVSPPSTSVPSASLHMSSPSPFTDTLPLSTKSMPCVAISGALARINKFCTLLCCITMSVAILLHHLTLLHYHLPHLGKQKTVCWYYPPEIDYRLSLLPENSKGLVLWLIEARVLSKSELQYLALLPVLQPKVKVIAECGTWRKVRWKPLREIAGLDLSMNAT